MNKTIFGLVAVLVLGGFGYYLFTVPRTLPVAQGEGQQNNTTNQSPVTSGENPKPGDSVHNLPAEPAAVMARKDLAAKLSVDEKSIVILKVEEKTWSDGCLGLGGPAESCLMALVDGFRVELLAKGETYVYRTDKVGQQVRVE